MPSRSHLLPALILAAGTVWSALTLVRGLEHRVPLHILWGVRSTLTLATIAACALLSAIAVLRIARGAPVPRGWARELFCLLVLAAILYVALWQPSAALTFAFTLSFCCGALALRMLAPQLRLPRMAELILFNLCLLVVGAEIGLRTLAVLQPSPLLLPGDLSVAARIEANRPVAGRLRFGFPCNQGGHYDEEFAPPAQRTGKTVAMIGDSFSAGVVPHAFHFTTVCEQQLPGVRVDNFGVTAIGPLHYLHMLRTEVLPLAPDAVIVDLFVGNDLDRWFHARTDWLHTWLDRDNVLLVVLPQRLRAVARERHAQGLAELAVGAPQDEGLAQQRIDDVAELRRVFPWVDDPSLEQPTFSPEKYLQIERQRAQEACGGASRSYQNVIDVVLEMRAACGAIPFAVMLIPDEFQLEDALWRDIEATAGTPLERDRPQLELGEALRAAGIPVLDLLPVLRAVPPMADGDRHLYHLRNTHFNARGNRVTGEALAKFVQETL
jgi:hypothetical protein